MRGFLVVSALLAGALAVCALSFVLGWAWWARAASAYVSFILAVVAWGLAREYLAATVQVSGADGTLAVGPFTRVSEVEARLGAPSESYDDGVEHRIEYRAPDWTVAFSGRSAREGSDRLHQIEIEAADGGSSKQPE
jgi:hypothetical protein